MYFQYGQEETEYLSGKDEKLGAVIAQVGRVNREVDTDLFSAVVHHIVGQQISTKAQATIWKRMRGALGTVDAEHILEAGNEQLQMLGISCRKAEYITDFARKIQNGEFDLEGIWQKPDEEVIRELSALKGIGVWTAEMILLFCMQRPDVFSYDDLAIQRGLRMVYHHRKIDRKLFEKYRWFPHGENIKSTTERVDAMMFTAHYQSPLGEILLAADEVGLTGLWFDRAKYYAAGLAPQSTERETPPLTEAKRWLDVYFSGKMPDFMPPLHPIGSDFRQEVWALLLQIPYGQTTTYGALAARLAAKHGTARLSAQAVGGAVGHNPISLIIPCHRVVGASGSLIGYAGGVERKIQLLKLEGTDCIKLFVPKKCELRVEQAQSKGEQKM